MCVSGSQGSTRTSASAPMTSSPTWCSLVSSSTSTTSLPSRSVCTLVHSCAAILYVHGLYVHVYTRVQAQAHAGMGYYVCTCDCQCVFAKRTNCPPTSALRTTSMRTSVYLAYARATTSTTTPHSCMPHSCSCALAFVIRMHGRWSIDTLSLSHICTYTYVYTYKHTYIHTYVYIHSYIVHCGGGSRDFISHEHGQARGGDRGFRHHLQGGP
jgi:hypothetical protein